MESNKLFNLLKVRNLLLCLCVNSILVNFVSKAKKPTAEEEKKKKEYYTKKEKKAAEVKKKK